MQDNNITSQTNNLNIKKTFKEKINFDAIFTGLFALVAVLFSSFVMSGFSFNSEIFTDVSFYISTIISFGIMMFTYSFVKAITVKKLKLAKDTDYYTVKQREQAFIKKVRDNHLEGLVEEKIHKVNEQRRIAAANSLLSQITYGLTYGDIIDLDNFNNIAINKKNFNEFCDKRDLDKKKRIALRLAINNVINGKFEYSEIKVKEILNDISVDKQFADVYSVDEIKLNLKETKRKSIIFLISTAITNAIIWDGISQAFWLSLLTQGMLILTSTISATMIANQRIATLSMVANNKCGLLNETLQDDKIRIYKEKIKFQTEQEELERKRIEQNIIETKIMVNEIDKEYEPLQKLMSIKEHNVDYSFPT